MVILNIGDLVRVKPPFYTDFSGIYEVIAIAEAPNTYTINTWGDEPGNDFYIDYLELAQ